MDFSVLQSYTQKETDQFKSVCNQLLSHTFVTRTIYRQDKGNVNNPDYTFLTIHYEIIKEYLALLDWDLHKNDYNGFFFVRNSNEANRCILNKKATAILLALRMIYDENQERLGLNRDTVCTVRDVLEKTVTDYAILSTRPNMDEVKQCLITLENHRVIQRIEGRFNQATCKFAILPTILIAVSSERLDAVVATLKQETNY